MFNFKPFLLNDLSNSQDNFANTVNKNLNSLDKNATGTIKRSSYLLTSISDAINAAGGLTSFSDISKIRLIRQNPWSNGGGKKEAIIDLNNFLNGIDTASDLRIYDGDSIFIPKLEIANSVILPKSIFSGLTPSFMSVSMGGKIENPGRITVPNDGSLSDAMDISGPRKPLR